jgi:hypothetical protein
LRSIGEPVAPGELNSRLVERGFRDSLVRAAAVYLWSEGEIHWTSEANWQIGLDPWLGQFNPNFVSRYS